MRGQTTTKNIPLQDLSSTKDIQNILDSANNVDMVNISVINDWSYSKSETHAHKQNI